MELRLMKQSLNIIIQKQRKRLFFAYGIFIVFLVVFHFRHSLLLLNNEILNGVTGIIMFCGIFAFPVVAGHVICIGIEFIHGIYLRYNRRVS